MYVQLTQLKGKEKCVYDYVCVHNLLLSNMCVVVVTIDHVSRWEQWYDSGTVAHATLLAFSKSRPQTSVFN